MRDDDHASLGNSMVRVTWRQLAVTPGFRGLELLEDDDGPGDDLLRCGRSHELQGGGEVAERDSVRTVQLTMQT